MVDVDRADVDLFPLRRPWNGLDRTPRAGYFLAKPGNVEQRHGLQATHVQRGAVSLFGHACGEEGLDRVGDEREVAELAPVAEHPDRLPLEREAYEGRYEALPVVLQQQ